MCTGEIVSHPCRLLSATRSRATEMVVTALIGTPNDTGLDLTSCSPSPSTVEKVRIDTGHDRG